MNVLSYHHVEDSFFDFSNMDPRPIIMSGELISSATFSVIAAEFESCMQSFQSLCAAIEANHQLWGSDEYDRLCQSRQAFLSWGRATGAANRSLDHALRKNSRLRTSVLELLEGLNGSLQSIMEMVQVTATPLLSPAPLMGRENSRSSYFDLQPQPASRFQGLPISEESIMFNFEDMVDTLERLNRLRPSLANPFPLDIFYEGALESDSVMDVDLISRMFPKAPQFLKQRIGKANWQRRRFLRKLQNDRSPTNQELLRTPGSSVRSPLLSPFASPFKTNIQQRPRFPTNHRAALRKVGSRSTSFSEVTSNAGTWWSKAESYTNYTSTSVGEPDEMPKSEDLTVPLPPVTLDPGACFLCSYCGQYIIVGEGHLEPVERWLQQMKESAATNFKEESAKDLISNSHKVMEVLSSTDWNEHVLADLEPYMCTVERCNQSTKTFGSLSDWYEHEMQAHRMKVWHCQVCGKEFQEPWAFKQHLEIHHKLSTEQSALLLDVCERFIEGSTPQLDCPFCHLACTTIASFRMHVGTHLEQAALTAIEEEEHSNDIDQTSSVDRAGSAEYANKYKLLEDFVFGPSSKAQMLDHLANRSQKATNEFASQKQATRDQSVGDHKTTNKAHPAVRPSMAQRGPSYTYLSSVRKQQIEKSGVQGSLAGMRLTDEDSLSTTIRTNPPPRNLDFIGRIDYMANIHNQLSEPGSICVLSGVGGIGKSALAAEYSHRFVGEYSFIFWVQAETPMICADTYGQIAIATAENKDLSVGEQRLVTLSREFLEKTTKKWLLIFDNVDEGQDLSRFLPVEMNKSTGSILITTRKDDIELFSSPQNFVQVHLSPLSLDDSRRLLLSSSNIGSDLTSLKAHPEYHLAGEVAKRAEKLPLALSLIAGYIIVSRCKLLDFVELWNERQRNTRIAAKAPGISASDADQAMETVWDIGLREVSSDAQKLLNILAFLDPDSIQKDLLVGDHDNPLLELLHSSEAVRYKRMTRELKNRRLIGVEIKNGEEIISIHRKLQAKILRDLNRDMSQRERVFRQVFLLVRGRFPKASAIQVPEPDKWPICKKYLPHVLSIRRVILGSIIDIPESIKLAQLFSDGGIDLWERGMTSEGLELLRAAETMLDNLKSSEKLLRANIHVIISLLLQDSGMEYIAECKDRAETALKIRRDYRENCDAAKYTKTDEILLYNAWADYGCVLLQYNDFEEAEPMFAQCFEKYQEWGPPETIPYEYAKYYHHMAHCLMFDDDMQDAVTHAEQGLHWVKVATGESAATNRWKFDLACIVLQSGDLKRALELHTEVLHARTQLHGKDGHLTLESNYAVGAICAYLVQFDEAEAQMRQVLELEKARPGSCSAAALARTQFHLSQILISQEEGSQLSQHPASDTAGTETSQHASANLRLLEAAELLKSAKKVLDRAYSTEARLSINIPSVSSIPEEHHLVLYDLMQSVFDGRFTGLNVLTYLRKFKDGGQTNESQ